MQHPSLYPRGGRGASRAAAPLAAAAAVGAALLLLVAGSSLARTPLSLSRPASFAPSRPTGVRALRSGSVAARATAPAQKLLVFGGSGFVGREVCKRAVERGFKVTSLSRRGENPVPSDPLLSQVNWVKGNALDKTTVQSLVKDSDAVVHTMGLLFDVNSGLKGLNLIVSGSKSTPDDDSTYENITRRTAVNIMEAIKNSRPMFGSKQIPFAFVSAAEAGWPDMRLGPEVEANAPDWLKRYLAAKRSVESMLETNREIVRPIIYRPSLIWNWGKLDVLPVIPIFNLANALGVPFVDKTVRVEALADAIVEGVSEAGVKGVQRFPQIESLAKTAGDKKAASLTS